MKHLVATLGVLLAVTSDAVVFDELYLTSSNVNLSASLASGAYATNSIVDVFVAYPALTNNWQWLCGLEVGQYTNLSVSVDAESLGLNEMPRGLFIVAGDRSKILSNMGDYDGDGIPNCYELYHGTHPYIADYNNLPMVTVGPDGDYSSIRAALAASSGYSVISIGQRESNESVLDMPAHPVMVIGPTNGYAFIRSMASPYVFALNQGQDERTLFRNIYLELLPSQSLQVGFWCGRNAAVGVGEGAPPASATFQNIYVKGNDGCRQCYGWMIRDWKDSRILLDRCVVNPAGATAFVGVSAIDTPDLAITNCTFVNFPPLGGDNYGVGIQVERIAVTNHMVVSVDGCIFDESFINAYPFGRLGSGYDISVTDSILPRPFPIGHGPDVSSGVIYASNAVAWTGHPIEGGVAEMLGIGALAAIGEAATLDSDLDGIADWLEVYRHSTDPFKADTDGDRIDDGDELTHGTDPRNRLELCFSALFTISNDYGAATLVKALYDEGVYNLTNDVNYISKEVFVTNGVIPELRLFVDADDDGLCATNELQKKLSYSLAGYDVRFGFAVGQDLVDVDNDGMPDWWELQNFLSVTNAADAFDDDDLDGLINLHEFWANCDPHHGDGSNTVLAAMSKSVDRRLPKSICPCLYSNYSLAGVIDGLVVNTNSWAYDIDLTCSSPWNGWHNRFEAGVMLTKRHALFARHYLFQFGPGDRKLYFRTRDGGCYQATVVSTNASQQTDLVVVLLDQDVPDVVSVAKILPADYRQYISNGKGLPILTFDQQEKALVHDIAQISSDGKNLVAAYPVKSDRYAQTEAIVSGDSGNPRFLILDNDPVLVSTITGPPNAPASGPFVTGWKDELQGLIDELSLGAGIDTNQYHLTECDFSQYQSLSYGVRQ